jgi:AraC-like DNA-binding protein
MALYVHNGERQLIQFQNNPTTVLSYPAFPGGTVRSFHNEKINFLIKEIISELFSIRYKIFQFSEKQKIESISDALGIHSRVMLQNELKLSVNSLGQIHQREGTISLLSGQIKSCTTTLEAGTQYRALDIYAGEDLASKLASFFPEVQFNANQIKNLLPFPYFVSPGLHKVIDAILDCPYDEATSHFYFDVKVREYFYLLLKECTSTKETKYRFTPFEIDRLVLAKDILLADLTKPPLTIKQLAKQAGINEFKLKVGFPQFFKTGVFECFQRARMFKAKQLLLSTNKPIKDICTMAGYPRMTNFITAFKNYFGYTPGSLRRKK